MWCVGIVNGVAVDRGVVGMFEVVAVVVVDVVYFIVRFSVRVIVVAATIVWVVSVCCLVGECKGGSSLELALLALCGRTYTYVCKPNP